MMESNKNSWKETKTVKKTRMLTALVLAGGLCLGGVGTAMADVDPSEGDAETPAQAKITKILNLPEDTETPVLTFTFKFTPVSVDDEAWDKSTASTSNMPQIVDPTAVYDGTESDDPAGGVISLPKETGDFAAGVGWPHAGVYVYDVTEFDAKVDDVAYSQAVYQVTFWVENCPVGDEAGCVNGLYVAGVGAFRTYDDEGEEVKTEEKVDPTPGGDGVTTHYSQLIFNNDYVETHDGDPEVTSDHQLTVSKTVEGDYADLSKYFAFDFTMAKPAVGVDGAPIYKAYVIEQGASGPEVVTTAANCGKAPTVITKGAYCPVDTGSVDPTTIYLKHGQAVVFVDLQTGVTYEAEEAAEVAYYASVVVVVNGGTGTTIDTDGETDTALSTGPRIVGAAANSAAFTNTRDTTSPTGVLLNNLPFIGLIVLGLAAVILVTVSRRSHNHA